MKGDEAPMETSAALSEMLVVSVTPIAAPVGNSARDPNVQVQKADATQQEHKQERPLGAEERSALPFVSEMTSDVAVVLCRHFTEPQEITITAEEQGDSTFVPAELLELGEGVRTKRGLKMEARNR
jgi:hypothetical protein